MQFHLFIFFSFHSVIGTLKQGHTLWIMSFLAFATMLPISMRGNCHSIRLVKSSNSIHLKKLFNRYPNVVKHNTKYNNDTALHYYLLSSRALTNQEIKQTVTFLVEKNIDAHSVKNNNRWYPVHIAAFHNLPIVDIIFHMAKEAPITITPDKHVHWNRQKY